MPRTASWLGRIDEINMALEGFILPVVPRQIVQTVLGISPRRAQQLMEGLPGQTVGTSFAVDKKALIARLNGMAAAETNSFEADRRAKFAEWVEDQRRARIEQPQVLVEAPTAIVNTRLEQLPAGVTVESGRITVEFASAHEACERLLALAMAIGNDPDLFAQTVEQS